MVSSVPNSFGSSQLIYLSNPRMTTLLRFCKQHKVVTLLLIGGVAFGIYRMFGTTTKVVTPITKSVAVTEGTLRVSVSGSGQIEAESQVDLKPVAAGDATLVTSVAVKNDEAVKKGQLIATIDSEDALRSVREAELSLKSAQIKRQQTEKEYAAKNVDETLVRRAQEVSVAQQELALQKAYSKLADYSIRAPFDGIVTGLDVDGGDTISQTAVLASVITKEMKAVISLNEVDVVKVHVGDTVNLTPSALPDMVLTGHIAKLDTLGTTTQGVVSYGAEIALDEQATLLKPGMSVTADIVVVEKKNVVLVPNEALTLTDGETSVRVGTTKRSIVVGVTDNVNTEVISGLKAGDQVMVATTTSTTPATSGNWLNSLFRGGNNRSR